MSYESHVPADTAQWDSAVNWGGSGTFSLWGYGDNARGNHYALGPDMLADPILYVNELGSLSFDTDLASKLGPAAARPTGCTVPAGRAAHEPASPIPSIAVDKSNSSLNVTATYCYPPSFSHGADQNDWTIGHNLGFAIGTSSLFPSAPHFQPNSSEPLVAMTTSLSSTASNVLASLGVPVELCTNPRVWICPDLQCQKTFTKSNDWKRHKDTHDKTMPGHRCCCDYNVKRKDNYLRHLRNCKRTAKSDHYRCKCGEKHRDKTVHKNHVGLCRATFYGKSGRPRAN